MPAWLDKLRGRRPGEAAAPPVAPTQRDAPALLAEGNRLLREGRPDAAERCYAQALDLDPGLVDAAVNLGFVLMRQQRAAPAAAALDRALLLAPDNVDANFMRGSIALELGDPAAALAHLGKTLELRPDFAPAVAPLAQVLAQSGERGQAREVIDQGLAREPRRAQWLFLRANLRRLDGESTAAIADYRAALEIEPALSEAQLALGQLLLQAGDLAPAEQALRAALAHPMATADAYRQAGDALAQLGLFEPARQAFQQALDRDAGLVTAWQNLGALQARQGDYPAALACTQRAVALSPHSAEALCNHGVVLQTLGREAEAVRCFERVLAMADPNDVAQRAPRSRAESSLAGVYLGRGDAAKALAAFGRAVQADPDLLEAREREIFALNYVHEPERYLAAVRAYGERVAAGVTPFTDWLLDASPGAPAPPRLRVGLVSADLRRHPVGYFIAGVVPHLAARGIELVAFPTGPDEDELSASLRGHCAAWVPVYGMKEAIAAQRIRAERVHLLLDLAAYTWTRQLALFAHRAAPVQATWLGYFASTGVGAIDYIIADPLCVPAGAEAMFTETVWRLPETRLCFTPPAADEAPPVSPLPAPRKGHVTFGSFQNLGKASAAVLEAWRRVLEAVPRSRLRLQGKQAAPDGPSGAQGEWLAKLRAAGLDPQRIDLAPHTDRPQYFAAHAEVDILLDTFPYTGGTTTCEALWMGVPTVTLEGRSMLGRQGSAMMVNAGLGDWVARDVDEYVRIAAAKAADLEALAVLRGRLRQQALASPLFDAARFASHLADALRGMWEAGPRAAGRSA